MATLLPLDTWREQIAYNPWHFWQLANALAPVTSACNSVVYKYAWQMADASGRTDIIRAIERAEDRLTNYLRFSPAPHFKIETLPFPRFPDRRFDRLGYGDATGRWLAVQLGEGYLQTVGVETRTLIGSGVVAYTDTDGDGLAESWSTSIATTVTDVSQIAVYFAAADRLNGDAVSEEYRIPVKVSISGGVATIRGKTWTNVKPLKYEGFSPTSLDPSAAANLITTVEIYRYYCDPTGTTLATSQAKLIWETRPHPYWCTCYGCATPADNSSDPAAEASAIARVSIRNAHLGLVGIGQAFYDSGSGIWAAIDWSTCRPPDKVQIRYQAGYPLDSNGYMDRLMQSVVTMMAAAELNHRICACDEANRVLYRHQFDLARTGGAGGEEYGAISSDDLNCPFGTRRGHVLAWKQVRDLRILTGVSLETL